MRVFTGCLNCQERTIEPSCKMTCQRYFEFKEYLQLIKDKKKKEYDVDDFFHKRGGRDRAYIKEKKRERDRDNT